MKSSPIRMVGFIAAVGLASAALTAAPPARAGGSATAAVGATLPQEASELLAKVHQEALGVRDSADTLEEYNRESFMIDWRADADTLERMRSQIDNMNRVVYQLRSMEGNLPQAQQAEVNQIAPAMLELTNTAQTAIDYLKNNQDRTMFPRYVSHANAMRVEANRIIHSTASSGS